MDIIQYQYIIKLWNFVQYVVSSSTSLRCWICLKVIPVPRAKGVQPLILHEAQCLNEIKSFGCSSFFDLIQRNIKCEYYQQCFREMKMYVARHTGDKKKYNAGCIIQYLRETYSVVWDDKTLQKLKQAQQKKQDRLYQQKLRDEEQLRKIQQKQMHLPYSPTISTVSGKNNNKNTKYSSSKPAVKDKSGDDVNKNLMHELNKLDPPQSADDADNDIIINENQQNQQFSLYIYI